MLELTPAGAAPMSSTIPSTGDRSRFNNLGDYAGWSESPPDDKSGTPLPGFTGWTRRVGIRYVQAGNIALGNATDTGIAEVTVRVRHRDQETVGQAASTDSIEASLKAYLSAIGAAERAVEVAA